jgi:hypothetical protein
MKKITTLAGLVLGSIALAAAPAHADDGGDFADAANAAGGWNFTAAAVCLQELAVVPALGDGDWVGAQQDKCSLGNVLDQAGTALSPRR